MIEFAANILIRELQYISSKDILEKGIPFYSVPIRLLQQICFHTDLGMNETALIRELHYLKEWVEGELDQEENWKTDAKTVECDEEGISVFDLLHLLVSKILVSSQGKIVYRYKYLEVWHLLNGKIGADLFAASAYAHRDFELFTKRDHFSGLDIISHDNLPLNEVLSRGMSDNHFHLRASAPYFTLSWISLMNSVTCNQVSAQLDKINEQPRNPKVRYRYQYDEDSFSILHLKAAAIRVYLYASLTGQMLEFGEYAVSIEWLLSYILEQEPLAEALYEKNAEPDGSISIQQFWSAQVQGGVKEIENQYTGFYWLFWECFPFIPLKCLEHTKKILCKNNRKHIAAYIKRNYEPLPLSRCAWLFKGQNKEIYHREWERQTKQALKNMFIDPYKIEGARFNIQHVIDGFHTSSKDWHKNKDYILNSMKYGGAAWEQAVISGEFWLVYEMERRRYFGSDRMEMQDHWKHQLFFAYLSIKEAFRSELLQNNEKIGFQNFHTYQNRKNWFTNAFSEGELAQIAVRSAFYRQKLKSLELRIMPKDTDIENIRMILGYDKAIGIALEQDGYRHYYVFHFGKRQDMDRVHEEGELYCRHAAFRDDLRHKAQAIMSMRERNPDAGYRLKGIDACSSEDGCRPEVFAVAFRVLRSHIVYQENGRKRLPQLRISYHAGEDNQDVLDGIRAINEAIYFLQLESGDRLGHATMLGVDAEKWYEKNDYKISIRQHDYLDNVAWLYHQIVHYHVSNQDNLLEYLEHEFQRYFNRIYEQHMRDAYNNRILNEKYAHDDRHAVANNMLQKWTFRTLDYNIHNYYYAWELRGDDPKLYRDGYYKKQQMPGSLWEDQEINRSVDRVKRDIDEAAILYHAYHYNEAVRNEGNKSVVVKIPYYMVRGITLVQKKLRMMIAKKGIAIETNPTSNLKIAGLEGYESHPIISFYNKGLTLDREQLYECPQINVSINTDDPGVFITSLYNEYTMMAGALEHIRMQDGTNVYKKDMVYDWINHIRKMGNRQSFARELTEGESKSI